MEPRTDVEDRSYTGSFVDLRKHLTRRRLILGSAATLAGAGALDALVIEPAWLDVKPLQHAIEGLPRALEGFTIAQITDAHLTTLGRVEDRILAAIRSTSPQMVVLTGDLIDDFEQAETLAELCAELSRTGATVLATLGNWEHWGKIDRTALERTYRKSDAKLLVDGWTEVEGVSIYASDDSTGGTPAKISPGGGVGPQLLLTHSPAFVDRKHPDLRFDLCLAGHTHGGQITAAGLAPFTPPGSGRYVAGWYETNLGPMYVSRGTGTSIAPARFMCRPELPLFELTRA